jgi:dipeptidyl aminopeptidase/acylaminoacyl peptidase
MGAGISNWRSFAGTTDIPEEMSVVHWNEWWYDEPDKHWARSPLSALSKAKTPTLIIHGASDPRVPPGQAWELYRGLQHHGTETQLVTYPRAGHGIGERAHWIDVTTRQLDWFSDRLTK